MTSSPTDPSTLVLATPPDARLAVQRAHANLRSRLFGDTKVSTIGRYQVRHPLGRGAHGVVYAAFDPVLQRPVAIKQLSRQHPTTRRALQREASALARLDHPNVVSVYEVGGLATADRPFLVMALVEGTSLRAWMDRSPRPWTAVFDMLLQSARGLAAAHDAGLVHRDFKPQNVLVGDDGRARVVDFGLARAFDQAHPTGRTSLGEDGSAPVPASDRVRTATRWVAGTPAYMAPEVARGDPADARADQFSLCVALYEGLWGKRPFGGQSLSELTANIAAGRVRAVPGSTVPRRVVRVVMRGLSVDRTERYSSMHALIAALESAVTPKRWRIGIVVGAVGATFGAAALLTSPRRHSVCDDPTAVLRPADSVRVREAITAGEQPWAPQVADQVEDRLDVYASHWVDDVATACTGSDLERRNAKLECLRDRASAYHAALDVLARPSDRLLERAPRVVQQIPASGVCLRLERAGPPPPSPTIAARVQALDVELQALRATLSAGLEDEVEAEARTLRDRAERLGYEPLLARVYVQEGRLRDARGDYEGAVSSWERAYFAATAVGADETALHAATALTSVVGGSLSRPDDAKAWAERARGLFARGAGDGTDSATFEASVAYNDLVHGDPRSALDRLQDIHDRAIASEGPTVATEPIITRLALAHVSVGNDSEAAVLLAQARDVLTAALGPHHPDVALATDHLGSATRGAGDPARALQLHREALGVFAALGRDHAIGTVRCNVGRALQDLDRQDEALAEYERCVPMIADAFGNTHPATIEAMRSLAWGYLHVDPPRPEDAARVARDALERYRPLATGADDPYLEQLEVELATAVGADQ